jgi:hypothetical protein
VQDLQAALQALQADNAQLMRFKQSHRTTADLVRGEGGILVRRQWACARVSCGGGGVAPAPCTTVRMPLCVWGGGVGGGVCELNHQAAEIASRQEEVTMWKTRCRLLESQLSGAQGPPGDGGGCGALSLLSPYSLCGEACVGAHATAPEPSCYPTTLKLPVLLCAFV